MFFFFATENTEGHREKREKIRTTGVVGCVCCFEFVIYHEELEGENMNPDVKPGRERFMKKRIKKEIERIYN
ncbi:MAG: hypothetical protein K9M75_00695 [Phycisphaerae bacterium]|nr:hypothetical protein [Phycisphaerae bacterium]